VIFAEEVSHHRMVVMLLGVGVYGYVIGNVASLLANIDNEGMIGQHSDCRAEVMGHCGRVG
jgi:hypothetical protein